MRDAHQGVPVAALPLGDWRADQAAPPASPGAPMAINAFGGAAPPTGRGARFVPPAPIPAAGGDRPPPRDKNIFDKLFGQM